MCSSGTPCWKAHAEADLLNAWKVRDGCISNMFEIVFKCFLAMESVRQPDFPGYKFENGVHCLYQERLAYLLMLVSDKSLSIQNQVWRGYV